jgi:predicted nucleotide-binding protein (sugar kinase/HSP70/actin superfamily)
MVFMFKKVVCEHFKTISKSNISMDVEDKKKPWKEVFNAAKQFCMEIWDKGGQQLATFEAKSYIKKVCP